MYNKKADFKGLGEKFNVDPLVIKILVNRGTTTEDEIADFLSKSDMPPSGTGDLYGMEAAAELISGKIDSGRKIRVIGDYDIDGVCATVILHKGLTLLGADADYVVPHRISDGYGINITMVESAAEDGIDTIVTCDNGIAASKEAKRARELGMTMVVTDHHEVPYVQEGDSKIWQLPEADVVVDPKQEADTTEFKDICGAVVALRLMERIWQLRGKDLKEVPYFYELGAFATIGDVMPIVKYNRALVKWGLKSMAGTGNIGLAALIRQTQIDPNALACFHIGFVLGPCINAGGRLDTAQKSVELLETSDPMVASDIAAQLVSINAERKDLTAQGTKQGLEQAEKYDEDRILVIHLPELHESLAGLVAGRIREQTHKPTLVITNAEEGSKGSGRSIPAYSMFDEMSACKDLFTKFGGHPMACGLSLPTENINIFRQRINELCTLTDEDMKEVVYIDASMPFSYVTEGLINQLHDCLEPTGNGNAKPIFAQKDVKIIDAKKLGASGRALKLTAIDDNYRNYTLMYFGDCELFLDYYREKYGRQQVEMLLRGSNSDITMTVTYSPQINEYKGRKSIQFIIDHYQ